VDRIRFLFIAVVLGAMVALVSLPTSASAGPPCNYVDLSAGLCNISGSLNGGTVTLSGNKNLPGSGGGTGKSGIKPKPAPVAPTCPPGSLPAACQKFIVIPPGAPGNPAVTINDLKNFAPVPGTDHMQPNGWMIVGLSTNFYSIVSTEVETGVLLGQPASVRFIPVNWHWTYGDGTGATRTTPGSTWATQGIPEFDPTATSHVYTAAGTYFIDLSITFTADYRYANGNWSPILGTITLPANRLEASAGDAKTVLVNHDCAQNPSGPGC
jgi:hypothetical protein